MTADALRLAELANLTLRARLARLSTAAARVMRAHSVRMRGEDRGTPCPCPQCRHFARLGIDPGPKLAREA